MKYKLFNCLDYMKYNPNNQLNKPRTSYNHNYMNVIISTFM